ncbi:HAD family hydrolase [Roseivirga pacifica]|uniref:HAD family hydrolase n=1 Tax=Roseivirga pacifica TaxID=1267423 RepID=UPI002094A6BF|nr:HAD-IA family hydrolase [Roseivirga pacifica]MCO6357446.1 HAD-IA family hydrolase [Roseivirga pacifica]MCO6367790.1 HAD-IA family hydrolase [Roseivirga pacifica]MCO6369679.1 HAD-IA family hydrolase [Roseivirga pacifica]MCO6373533.1 HAD-IA family hydrolase [Roseivirga pacifica]MCO6377162.1 HAD-IA family hydrolase [Roseivirga pacifica]
MKSLENYKVILWDFDGVILDSMAIRDQGFVEVLKEYSEAQVNELLVYHRKNGGLSRYVKFRYFFEEIRGEEISNDSVNGLAEQFSNVMKSLLINPSLLISDSLNFIIENVQRYKMHIVSGSDGNELRYLCEQLDIDQYFLTIDGSPTPKKQLVKSVLSQFGYAQEDCVLIGDSINDFEAAESNSVDFMGFNNSDLMDMGTSYIKSFK